MPKTKKPDMFILGTIIITVFVFVSIVGVSLQYQTLLIKEKQRVELQENVTDEFMKIAPDKTRIDNAESNTEPKDVPMVDPLDPVDPTDSGNQQNAKYLENACLDYRQLLNCPQMMCDSIQCECFDPAQYNGCTTNAECSAPNSQCHTTYNVCVECLRDAHCSTEQECRSNVCTTATVTGCTSNADCSAPTDYCNASTGVCVACMNNSQCGINELCRNNSCVPEGTVGSAISGNLAMSGSQAVYDVLSPTQSTPFNTNRGPQFSGMAFDKNNSLLYLNDHVGVYRFAVNALETASVQPLDLLGSPRYDSNGNNQACLIKPNEQFVSNCVAYSGDTAGYSTSRAPGPFFIDENQVYVKVRSYTTHTDSWIVFDDADGTNTVESEYTRYMSSPIGAISREGGGIAYLGGVSPYLPGDVVMLFSPGAKRYALVYTEGSFDGSYRRLMDTSKLKLVDITNALLPNDLGFIGNHPELENAITSACDTSSGDTYCEFTEQSMPEKLAVARVGSERVLYDFTDPINVVELDRWTQSGTMDFTGFVDGKDVFLSNDTVYVHYPSQMDNYRSELGDLNPKKLERCWYDRKSGHRACYYGQIWKHEMGATGWSKVLDVPAWEGLVHDGKLIILGKVFDPPNQYGTYNLQVTDTERLWVYDLENEEWMLKTKPYLPEGCNDYFAHGNRIAATTKNGNYYVYIPLKNCGASAAVDKTYIWGYELTQCTDAIDCANKTVDNPTGTTCVPDCSGKPCGASDGCEGYCVDDSSCQAGYECLPRHYTSATAVPRCMCRYGSPYTTTENDNCTPGAEKFVVKGTVADGRCSIQPYVCSGVSGCSAWIWQTSYPGLYWREQLEAMGKPVDGIEQCAYSTAQ